MGLKSTQNGILDPSEKYAKIFLRYKLSENVFIEQNLTKYYFGGENGPKFS